MPAKPHASRNSRRESNATPSSADELGRERTSSGRIWKGSISFGLLNIPVTLQTASEEKELHFSMLDRETMSRIQFRRVSAETGREVPYDRIIKGYEFKPGKFVAITDTDFRAANPKATQTIDIEDFVKVEEIDPLLFERPYYLVPQKGGEKGYALLRDALASSGKVAVSTFVLRTKQHLALVMPRENYLILEILRFANEVKEVHEAQYLPKARKKSYSDRELVMAEQLIGSMTGKWAPNKYKDTYRADLMRRINARIKRGQTEAVDEEPTDVSPTPRAEVIDLLPLLQKSLGRKKSRSPARAKG